MHRPPARRLPLPYLQIINPLEGLVGAEDQTRNKPADMFKAFRTTKDLSKAFHPLGKDLRYPNNRQHGLTRSFSISTLLFSSIHPFFPITFQVVSSNSVSTDCANRARNRRTCSVRTLFLLVFIGADPAVLSTLDNDTSRITR